MCLNPALTPALPDLRITTFTSPQQALAHARNHCVDIVISDYRMPEMDGATLLTRIRSLQPDTGRIVLSACADMDGIARAINDAGIFRFVGKPWSDSDLRATLAQLIEHRALLLENRRLADEVRAQQGLLARQQHELARLEAECPGITRVRWSDDGGVLLES
jgi:response regulator RpfG family c-di-GMP phosphodiesterase